MVPSPAPATSNAACRFPRTALSLLASCQGLWDLSGWECFRLRCATNPIAVEQLQFLIPPAPTPPLPAEASPIPGSPHVTPDLLFYPVFDEAQAFAGVSDSEVVYPAPQHRIDQSDHPVDGLGLVPPEHTLSLRNSAVRFFNLGVWCARHTCLSILRRRRKSNPRKPKLSA
jgi:hypothetical protein